MKPKPKPKKRKEQKQHTGFPATSWRRYQEFLQGKRKWEEL